MKNQEQKIFKLAEIISESFQRELREDERMVLDKWLEASEQNKMVYQDFQDEAHLGAKVKEIMQIDWQGDSERYIQARRRRARGKQLWRWMSTAAVLVLAVVFYQLYTSLSQQPVATISEMSALGDRKAILTLGGGEQVVLSEKLMNPLLEQNGMLLSVDSLSVSYLMPRDCVLHEKSSPVYNTLNVPRGGEYLVTLSDGTKVWINAESELRYPVQFVGDQRTVYLEGEAFFMVSKNDKKPFVVVTDRSRVKVLGTEFNLRAYPEEPAITTTLVEGRVLFYSDACKQEVCLTPGEQGTLLKEDGYLSKRDVDVYPYVAWKEGRLVFRDARVEELLGILARWYDLTVFYQNQEAKDIRFTGDLNKTDNFESILKIIENNERVIFDVNERTVSVRLK